MGAITVSYNLPGVKSGLKLDGPTIADIFLGKIKTWNDPAIKALNPGVQPAEHRDHGRPPLGLLGHDATASRPTSRDVDPAWKSTVGEGKDVQWPTGTGAKGNSGVAGAVKQTTGAVGYVEQAYALENGFTVRGGEELGRQLGAADARPPRRRGRGVKVPANLGIQ